VRIQRFEDVQAWQAGRELVRLVYAVSRQGRFARDARLASQMQSAAISVISNIAEGFDAGSDAEFIRFLRFSSRSASEVQSQLYAALDVGYIDEATFQRLYDKSTDVKKLINAFIRYLRTPRREKQKDAAPAADAAKADRPPS
jgi:four helix bundle protein